MLFRNASAAAGVGVGVGVSGSDSQVTTPSDDPRLGLAHGRADTTVRLKPDQHHQRSENQNTVTASDLTP